MPMALGMNTISNCDFMPYTIAASLQMSDEPNFYLRVEFCLLPQGFFLVPCELFFVRMRIHSRPMRLPVRSFQNLF